MRTVEDFEAKYGYVTNAMVAAFADLCQLTETTVGKAWVQYVADKTGEDPALVERYVLDGTLTQEFIKGVKDVVAELKKGDA